MTIFTILRSDKLHSMQYNVIFPGREPFTVGWIGSNEDCDWGFRFGLGYFKAMRQEEITPILDFLKLAKLASMDWRGKKGSPILEGMRKNEPEL